MTLLLSDTRGAAPYQKLHRLSVITAAVLMSGAIALMAVPAAGQDVTAPAKAKSVKAKAAAKQDAKDATADSEQPAPAPKKRDPAEAQRTLDSGIKLLQAGKAEQAVQSFSVVISGGNLPTPIMAKALHQRGAAYRAMNKPALALSDLTSALWLKGGLTETDRADAVQQRAAAYREAGLPDQTDGDGKPAGASTSRRATAAAAPGSGSLAAGGASSAPAVTTASLAPNASPAQASTSSPLGNLFGNLFGGGATSPAAAPAASLTASAPSAPTPSTSAWSSGTSVATPRVKTAAAAPAAVPPSSTTPALIPVKASVPDGSVHARMIARNEAEANALAGRLKGEFAAQLGGRSASVSQAQFGGMGSFFQVRVGPYASAAEAQDFCKRVKTAGADCVAVTQ